MSNKLSTSEPKFSATDRQNNSQYLREFIPGIAAYVVTLLSVLLLVDEDSQWAHLWILLPVSA